MTYEEIFNYVEENLKKGTKKGSNIAVEFDIYGEGEGAFYVKLSDGELTVAPYEYYDRDAKVFISGEELIKIAKKEKTAEQSLSDGVLTVEGNQEAAMEILKLFGKTARKTTQKKSAGKDAGAKKVVSAEKEIVSGTKTKNSKIAKDIKK